MSQEEEKMKPSLLGRIGGLGLLGCKGGPKEREPGKMELPLGRIAGEGQGLGFPWFNGGLKEWGPGKWKLSLGRVGELGLPGFKGGRKEAGF